MEGLTLNPVVVVVPLCPEHSVRMVHHDDVPKTSPWQCWRCPLPDCRHRELTEFVEGFDA